MNEIVHSKKKSTIKIIYQNKILYDLLSNNSKNKSLRGGDNCDFDMPYLGNIMVY